MKWILILSFFAFTSCSFYPRELCDIRSWKHAKKIALLQKKLDVAEKELEKRQFEVVGLRTSILSTQLLVVEKKISYIEEQFKKNPNQYCICPDFMWEEREQLLEILEEHPGSVEIHELLDRILCFMANRSDR